MHVYFDTSVYDHIDKERVPSQDVKALQCAVDRADITVYVSPHNVEELSGQWEDERTRPAAIRRLRVASALTRDFRFLLNAAPDLLQEAIAAYAGGHVTPPSMLRSPHREKAMGLLRWATRGGASDPDSPLHGLMLEMLAAVRRSKHQFIGPLKPDGDGFARVEHIIGTGVDPKKPVFEDLWQRQAEGWARAFAERQGLAEECVNRGLEGLLGVRPVRLAVGAMMSRAFSVIVGGCNFDRNDGYDMWHAVSAAPADALVTFDADFKTTLDRVPTTSFQLFSSLREMLRRLAERS